MKTIIPAAAFMTAVLLIATGIGRTAARPEPQNALSLLIEAERAFSKTSEEKGIREAFLTWLAPDAIVFRPGPVEGRPVYEKMDPANPAVLSWQPEFAEIAASGEIGYTTGPYEIRPGRDAEPSGFGHYISIWKKQPDGAWRVLLDIGVQHGRPAASAGIKTVASPAVSAPAEPIPPEALRDVEYAFGIYAGTFDKEVATKGLAKGLSAFATEDVRVYRPGKFPAVLIPAWGPQWGFIGYGLALAFGALGLSPEVWEVVHSVFFWLHFVIVLGVLYYLPFSRFFHVIMGPVIVAYNTTMDRVGHGGGAKKHGAPQPAAAKGGHS